jgi:hypothetical protein
MIRLDNMEPDFFIINVFSNDRIGTLQGQGAFLCVLTSFDKSSTLSLFTGWLICVYDIGVVNDTPFNNGEGLMYEQP